LRICCARAGQDGAARNIGENVDQLLARGVGPRLPGEEFGDPRLVAMLRGYTKRVEKSEL
jgi:hypothetical protein